MEKIDTSKKAIKNFALIFAVGFSIISLFAWRHHKNWYLIPYFIGLIVLITNFTNYLLLKPLYIFWMRLGFVLGWINTRIILLVVFYLVVTPIALIMRLMRKDLLNLDIDKQASSYWIKKQKDNTDYQKQF